MLKLEMYRFENYHILKQIIRNIVASPIDFNKK